MWVVAVAALHLAIAQRMRRGIVNLGALLQMAGGAGLHRRLFISRGAGRGRFVDPVAIAAFHPGLVMRAARPMHLLAALVTAQARCILLLRRRCMRPAAELHLRSALALARPL